MADALGLVSRRGHRPHLVPDADTPSLMFGRLLQTPAVKTRVQRADGFRHSGTVSVGKVDLDWCKSSTLDTFSVLRWARYRRESRTVSSFETVTS
jgi:hypothetical protein